VVKSSHNQSMKYPNFNEEKILHKQGFKCVVGLDEAGRGPLAGPVVAAAVWIKKDAKFLEGINDSKKLSEKQRENFYKILINHKDVEWGIGIVSEKVIDKINILQATKLAMKKALQQAQGKLIKKLKPDFLILDGNFTLRQAQGEKYIPQKSIIKGDTKVISISAASIIAKVTRDRIMNKYNKKYPQYGFDKHKGYGTAHHIKMIKQFGACAIHRKTFRPVSEI
jgi:ribonuclease HII